MQTQMPTGRDDALQHIERANASAMAAFADPLMEWRVALLGRRRAFEKATDHAARTVDAATGARLRVFIPVAYDVYRPRGKRRKVIEPRLIMDRYVFFGTPHCGAAPEFRAFFENTATALPISRPDGSPMAVTCHELQTFVDANGCFDRDAAVAEVMKTTKLDRPYAEGDEVRITGGPLRDFVGIVRGYQGNHAVMDVRILGNVQRVLTPIDTLELFA